MNKMWECVNCKKMEVWTDGYDGKMYFYICSACGWLQEVEEEREID